MSTLAVPQHVPVVGQIGIPYHILISFLVFRVDKLSFSELSYLSSLPNKQSWPMVMSDFYIEVLLLFGSSSHLKWFLLIVLEK